MIFRWITRRLASSDLILVLAPALAANGRAALSRWELVNWVNFHITIILLYF